MPLVRYENDWEFFPTKHTNHSKMKSQNPEPLESFVYFVGQDALK